ncbi:hypothetical protein [Bacteroides acidifaciens]|uniref:hypothetical protein n=1 Tax=Bacteroides acidifaciens TaxID=85831 RepID=UPI00259617E0|nr:hypothetical protein [Bacteroides acidifaciens]
MGIAFPSTQKGIWHGCTLTTSYFTLQDAENSGAMQQIRHDCLCPALCDIVA